MILILMLFAMTSYVFAQEYGYEDVTESMDKFGVKLGLNFANMNADPDDPNYMMAVKFPYIGIVSNMNLSKIFNLQGEFGYSLLGAKYDLFSNADPMTISLGYINIAALMKAYFFDNLGINVFVGLQYGYLVYASHDDLDRLDNYKSSDFDMLVGLGYKFDIGFFTELRYLLGFTNISNLQDIHYSSSVKNNALQLQFGWMF